MTLAVVTLQERDFVIAAEGAAVAWAAVAQARQAAQDSADYAQDSAGYAQDSAISASVAESAAGPTYPDTAAGLAATSDGESFAVDNGDGTVTIYLNDNGVAVEQRTLATTAALAAGTGASLVGYEPATGVLRSVAQILGDVISVRDYGALGDDVTDDSVAAEKAIAACALAGGGVVHWPAGKYRVLDLSVVDGVRHAGDGWWATTLTPPSGTTSGSIFRYKGTGVINATDWSNMTIDGGASGRPVVDWSDMDLDFLAATPSRDFSADIQRWFGDPTGVVGIDMGAATRWEDGTNIGLFVTRCWRGVNGSQNDRKANFISTRIWGNFIGYYSYNNHSHWLMSDFRNNDIGNFSRAGYDQQLTHCTWVNNGFGILPDVTQSNGGRIQQTHFSNCYIFNNVYAGAVVNSRVQFHGCLLVHGTLGAPDSFGVRFKGRGCQWNGGNVRGEGSLGFGDAAFIVDKLPGDIITDVLIKGVSLFTRNVCRIDFGASATAAQVSLTGANGWITGYLFRVPTGKSLEASSVSGNNVTINSGSVLVAGEAFIDIPVTTTLGVGNIVSNNTLRDQSSSPAFGIRVDARRSVITGNIVNLPYEELFRDDNTQESGNIFPDNVATWRTHISTKLAITPGTIAAGAVWTSARGLPGIALGRPLVAGYSVELSPLILSVEAQTAGFRVKIFNPTAEPVAVAAGTLAVTTV